MTEPEKLQTLGRPHGMPFRIGKIGHVVLNVGDLARAVRFYTEVLGLEVSDVYPDAMVPGGMAFLRCNPDHHGVALVGSLAETSRSAELTTSPSRWRRSTRCCGHATTCNATAWRSTSRAAAAPAVRSRSFRDPDDHRLEIYWGIDQIGSDGRARPAAEWNGVQGLDKALADPVPGQGTTLQDPTLLCRAPE